MSKFDQIDYTDFVAGYSLRNGALADETVLNSSPQRLKKVLS